MTSPHAQSQYQVRFEWGIEGARTIAEGADVIVLVDVLSFTTAVDIATALGVHATSAETVDAAALAKRPTLVVAGSLRNRRAVAAWVFAQQGDKGDRFTVAVVGSGESREDGSTRFAIEDLLGAGAVIDALADLGIDDCSPEAAAASAAFTGLRNATGHLIGASASGRELTETGHRDDIELAIDIDASTAVPVLGEFRHSS